MNELEQLRQKIDEIDRQLLPLFIERMEVCGKVADYKRKVGKAVLDAEREKQVLESKLGLPGAAEMKHEVYEFFNAIMTISRVRQSRMLETAGDRRHCGDILEMAMPETENPRVIYFGNVGAYSEEAAISFFGKDSERFYAKAFEDAFKALRDGRADYAVLPIENSSTGMIADVADLLVKNGCFIVGEVYIPIRHCLMGVSGASISDIKKVYSHEQALLQCREFIKSMGDVQSEAFGSTALSAKAVADMGDKTRAAIASIRTAEIYGLEVLAEEINTSEKNTTRFVIISKSPELRGGADKISAAFTLKHESGALYRMLSCFARGGLNLLKLESRPIPDSPFEYRFFVDYTGNITDETVRSVTDTAIEETDNFVILGNYLAGR